MKTIFILNQYYDSTTIVLMKSGAESKLITRLSPVLLMIEWDESWNESIHF